MLNMKKITVALCIAAVALTAVESQAEDGVSVGDPGVAVPVDVFVPVDTGANDVFVVPVVESQAASTIGVKKMLVPSFDAGTFNGETSISLGNSVGNFGTKNFKINFDVRTTMNTKTMILDKRDVCDNTNYLQVEINADGHIGFSVNQDNLATNIAVVTNTTKVVNDGKVHHVAIIRSAKALLLSIDGGTPAVTKTTGVANVDNISEFLVASNVCLGIHGQETFIGDISHLSITKY